MLFFNHVGFDSQQLARYRQYNIELKHPTLDYYLDTCTGQPVLPSCICIFNSLVLLNGFACFFGFLTCLLEQIPPLLALPMLVCSAISFFTYYLSYVKSRFKQALCIALAGIYLSFIHVFYLFGGVSASFSISFLVFFLNFLFIIRPTRYGIFTIFNLCVLALAFFAQAVFPKYFYPSVSEVLIASNGIFACIYATSVLYTAMYIMKREASLLRKNIEIQSDALREVARVQNQMISIISHDVRAPLTNIEQMLQMIASGIIPDSKRSEFDKQLLGSTRQTREILESMVTWTRAQVSDFGLVNDSSLSCDLDVVVRREFPDWEIAAQEKQIDFKYQTHCALPALISADQNLAKTILRNLIFNALKFTPVNGKVTVEISESDSMIRLAVTDSGIGIPTEQLSVLFHGRLTSRRGTNGEKGSGLGLWIIGDMLQRIGGTIEVESKVAQGSTFIASIPKYK